jgi:hypothetical protein
VRDVLKVYGLANITVVKRVRGNRPKASRSKYRKTHVFSPRLAPPSTYSSVIAGGVAAAEALDFDIPMAVLRTN